MKTYSDQPDFPPWPCVVTISLVSSSSSFNIPNDVGHHHHRYKSVISHHFKVWWPQAVTSLWCLRASSNRHFYQSHQWRRPLNTTSINCSNVQNNKSKTVFTLSTIFWTSMGLDQHKNLEPNFIQIVGLGQNLWI